LAGPFTEVVTTKLKLSNPTNERVVFKVKTTAPKQYCVRPNSGLIEPHKSQEVSVMLQPMDTVPVADRAKHKFMVQSLCVADNFIPEDLDATMRQADKTKLMDSKLKCLFIDNPGGAQPSPPSTSDKPSDSESSSVVTHMMDDVSVTPEENPHASKSQPTAGSTPSVSGRQNEMEADMQSSEMRVLQDKAKKLAEENKTLKVSLVLLMFLGVVATSKLIASMNWKEFYEL
jgi:hypothetical protein